MTSPSGSSSLPSFTSSNGSTNNATASNNNSFRESVAHTNNVLGAQRPLTTSREREVASSIHASAPTPSSGSNSSRGQSSHSNHPLVASTLNLADGRNSGTSASFMNQNQMNDSKSCSSSSDKNDARDCDDDDDYDDDAQKPPFAPALNQAHAQRQPPPANQTVNQQHQQEHHHQPQNPGTKTADSDRPGVAPSADQGTTSVSLSTPTAASSSSVECHNKDKGTGTAAASVCLTNEARDLDHADANNAAAAATADGTASQTVNFNTGSEDETNRDKSKKNTDDKNGDAANEQTVHGHFSLLGSVDEATRERSIHALAVFFKDLFTGERADRFLSTGVNAPEFISSNAALDTFFKNLKSSLRQEEIVNSLRHLSNTLATDPEQLILFGTALNNLVEWVFGHDTKETGKSSKGNRDNDNDDNNDNNEN